MSLVSHSTRYSRTAAEPVTSPVLIHTVLVFHLVFP